MNKAIAAPSILAADFRNLEREFDKINASNAEWIHFDVMDGMNVPNISFGFPILDSCRKLTSKYIDVHLMIENPSRYFEEFKKYGADGLTIHYEKNENLKSDFQAIKKLGMKVGLVLNPETPIAVIEEYLDLLDLVLIMSVYPGFGGQKFIESTYHRVEEAHSLIANPNIILEVDGGVTNENAGKLRLAGANALVSGSALFNSSDFNRYVLELQGNV